MIDLEFWVSERVFWVERGTEEAKEGDLKNCHCWLLKTEKPLISRVSFS